jgi:hypothetical protein
LPAAHGAFFSWHHLRQSVSCLSSIENTAPSLTSTFRTMQTRPILSARFWGLVEILQASSRLGSADAKNVIAVD